MNYLISDNRIKVSTMKARCFITRLKKTLVRERKLLGLWLIFQLKVCLVITTFQVRHLLHISSSILPSKYSFHRARLAKLACAQKQHYTYFYKWNSMQSWGYSKTVPRLRGFWMSPYLIRHNIYDTLFSQIIYSYGTVVAYWDVTISIQVLLVY